MKTEVAVIGGGIVGLATAWRLLERQPGRRVVVLEKEEQLARHQSGRNSGVLHSGIYYRPGSLKASLCRAGHLAMERFCRDQGLPFQRSGKVILATQESELSGLAELQERGRRNGVDSQRLGAEELREKEPHAAGTAALFVPSTAVLDFAAVCQALAASITAAGGEVRTSHTVRAIHSEGSGVVVAADPDDLHARAAVACGGLHADSLARASGARPSLRLIPFRGEYYRLAAGAEHLCRGLIYPVPDPDLPFLGTHLTRRVDGSVECGPNAVLAGAREGYERGQIAWREAMGTLFFRGFWKMAWRHRRSGLAELRRSRSRKAFLGDLQRLVPELRGNDMLPAPAGVRAQAVSPAGELLDDFAIVEEGRAIHVLNAPSPAATSSLALGDHLARLVEARLG